MREFCPSHSLHEGAQTHTNINHNVKNGRQLTLGINPVHLSHGTRVITFLKGASFQITEEEKGGRLGERQSRVGS